jgi:hypothetical protein
MKKYLTLIFIIYLALKANKIHWLKNKNIILKILEQKLLEIF